MILSLILYLCNEDNSVTLGQSVVVDENGYVTVQQDHCSDYVLTTEELSDETIKDIGSPKTGDTSNLLMWTLALVGGIFLIDISSIAYYYEYRKGADK